MKFKTVLVIELHLPDEEKESVLRRLKEVKGIKEEMCIKATRDIEYAIRKIIIPMGDMTINGKTKLYFED